MQNLIFENEFENIDWNVAHLAPFVKIYTQKRITPYGIVDHSNWYNSDQCFIAYFEQ